MKKYVKPDVAFEGFELSQHIAGGCSILMNHSDINNCENTTTGDGENWFLPTTGFFAEGSCDLTNNLPICYYNGADGVGIFQS